MTNQISLTSISSIDINEAKDEIHIYGIGESTGFLPMKIPFAPFFNIFLCGVPFRDMGNNKRYLERIAKHLETNKRHPGDIIPQN